MTTAFKETLRLLDSRQFLGFRNWWWGLLALAGLAVVAYWAGVGRGGLSLPDRFSVFVAGVLVVGLPSALYLMRGVSFEKAAVLMVLTLPLLFGFVLDIGGNLRIPYFFAVLAFGVGLLQGKLRTLPLKPAVLLLAAFVLYAIFSTALTLGADTAGPREAVGFRLSSLRAIIQAGQLLLMVMSMYVTVNYLTSYERLRQFSNLVFWSTAAVTLYGFYDFLTALLKLPFFSVIYDLSYYAGGADSPFFSAGGVTIPRPRATLGEPLDLSIFLLFGIPFAVASLVTEKSPNVRLVKVGFIFLACLLFLVANSRSSLLAVPVILAAVLWLAPTAAARLKMLLGAAFLYVLVALVLFPMAGGKADLLFPVEYYQERMESIKHIGANFRGEPEGGVIGRGYSLPIAIFRDHPAFGVGLGNYPFYYSKLVDSPVIVLGSPFSLYFRLLTELGIIGTSVFLLFVTAILWSLLRVVKGRYDPRFRPYAMAALIAIVGVMIARVGLDGLFTDNYMWVMFGAGLAIPWLAARERQQPGEELTVSSEKG